MKTLSLFATAVMLSMAMACSKQSEETAVPLAKSDEVTSIQSQLASLYKPGTVETLAVQSNELSPLTQKKIALVESLQQAVRKAGGVSAQNDWIPQSVTGAISLVENRNFFIDNSESPTLASGTYYCQVYKITATVTFPQNAGVRVDAGQMAKIGYSNYTTKLVGILSATSYGATNYLQMTTYSVLPVSNILGQPVSAPALPAGDLTNLVFKWSYIL
jgi:hypothetical protein